MSSIRLIKLLIGLLAFTIPVAAQSGDLKPPSQPQPTQPTTDTTKGSIRGRVVLPNGLPSTQAVRVTLQNLRGTQDVVFTDNQGQFEIRNVIPGDYTLEIESDKLRFEVSVERVQVFRSAPTIVTVALKEKSASGGGAKPAGGAVSVGEFGKEVPAKARKEFDRASKASKEGKSLEAIDHLRRAIAVYPDFMMAHNDLGAQLLEQGNLFEAAVELRRAIELDEKAFNPYLNLGIVLLRQQKFSGAADILRKALSLESNSPAARLYMGLALMGQNDSAGAEKELKAAYDLGGAQYAVALFHLGEIYMNKGERALSLEAFEAYLRHVPDAANAGQVRKLIDMLR